MKRINLITGKTESGKTRGIMFEEIKKEIDQGKNFYFIDNKEEYYNRFQEELEEQGYKTYLVNLNDPAQSNGLNILRYPYTLYRENNIEASVELVQSLCKSICQSNSSMDSFWENSSSDFLTAIILILFKEAKPEEINLYSVANLLSYIDIDGEKSIEKLRKYLTDLDVMDPIYRLASSTVFAPIETRGGILSTLKTVLGPYLGRPQTMEVLSTDELEISKLKEKWAIFFSCRDSRQKVSNIIISQLLHKNKTRTTETIFVLDNLNKMPTIEFIDELIEYARVNQTKTYIITNDIEELKSKYKPYTFNNIENIIDTEKQSSIQIDQKINCARYPHFTVTNKNIAKLEFLK